MRYIEAQKLLKSHQACGKYVQIKIVDKNHRTDSQFRTKLTVISPDQDINLFEKYGNLDFYIRTI